MLLARPLIVTVEFPIVPLEIVATPLPELVIELAKDLILTIVPAPSLTSGLVLGKDVSLSIATKPPTSSTKATTRKSTEPGVTTKSSLVPSVGHVSLLLITSSGLPVFL